MIALLVLYAAIAFVLAIMFTMALVEELRKNGETRRARTLALRILLSLVWPLLIPVGLIQAFRLAIGKGQS
jgi:hypothetical protein